MEWLSKFAGRRNERPVCEVDTLELNPRIDVSWDEPNRYVRITEDGNAVQRDWSRDRFLRQTQHASSCDGDGVIRNATDISQSKLGDWALSQQWSRFTRDAKKTGNDLAIAGLESQLLPAGRN